MTSIPPRSVPTLASLPLVIELPRLKLRPFAQTDVDDLWPFVSDPELPRHMSWAAHRDRSETVAFVERAREGLAKGTDVTWAIERSGSAGPRSDAERRGASIEHDRRVIGCIGLSGITWQFRAWRIDRAELGYWLGKPHWGQGLMSEAALAATRWGFETLGLHKITIGCIDGNVGSQRVIEKIGFRFLAVALDDVWRDGAWHAHRRYELTAAEWGDTTRTLRFNRPRPT